jgi:hypothetical protein
MDKLDVEQHSIQHIKSIWIAVSEDRGLLEKNI